MNTSDTRPFGSDSSAEVGQMPARWYCVSADGVAMLCKAERDAQLQAAESDSRYPGHAPHKAVRLGDVAAERERWLRPANAQAFRLTQS